MMINSFSNGIGYGLLYNHVIWMRFCCSGSKAGKKGRPQKEQMIQFMKKKKLVN